MANIDRQMRKVCDTFGEERVLAWVHANLSAAYPSSRRGAAGASAGGNQVLRAREAAADEPYGRVLMDREHPEREEHSAPEAPAPAPAPAQPRYTPGAASIFSLWN